MKLYLNGFWNDDSLDFFVLLIQNVFEEPIELGSFEESDILFESVFGRSRLFDKQWKWSFFFNGESDRRTPFFMQSPIEILDKYSCVLKGEPNNGNRINLPLFVYYSYLHKFTERFIQPPFDLNTNTTIPTKNVCAIISNGHDEEGRNAFLDKLNQVIPVDFAGTYHNNVTRIEHRFCSPAFIEEVAKYKFIVSMENSKNHTYITEKILHGFAANTIPVYWGSDLVENYFNPARFIHVKQFDEESIQHAIERITELMNDESKYREMVSQPIYTNNQIPFTIRSVAKDVRQLLGVASRQKIHFLTFGGPTANYHNTMVRICNEANAFDAFSTVYGATEKHLMLDTNFWNKHGGFITNNRRGYGYWLWKSYLIMKRMNQIDYGDILVYCDGGCSVNSNGKARFEEYIDMLNTSNTGVLSFLLPHKEQAYTKRKVYEYFDMSPQSDDSFQNMATVILLKKTANSVALITEWYSIMQQYELINDTRYMQEYSAFIDHRHDQSIWSMLLKKYPHIEVKDETWFGENWNKGFKYPFLATRIK